ncbi:hypothetical protein [Scytonema sp. NUACC21]
MALVFGSLALATSCSTTPNSSTNQQSQNVTQVSNNVHLNNGKAGTVFAGEARLDLTIGELLRKQKNF